MHLEVLHVDNHLLVVRKPACVPVVPDASEDSSLLDAAKEWVKREYEKPGRVFLGVVHRLDRPVSGVVVFARTSKAAARLTEQFRVKSVRKLYRGVAEGAPRDERGTVRAWLKKDRVRNRVTSFPREVEGAKHAVTQWRVVGQDGRGRTRYELEPETGRSHQLRVAAASLGTPLLGDVKYGASLPLSDQSIALHAAALELEHPVTKERLRFETPPPRRDWWNA